MAEFEKHGGGGVQFERHKAVRGTDDKSRPRSARPWRRIRKRVLIRDRWTCQQCARVDEAAEVDHIKPRCDGGTDDEENLQTLCTLCHRLKTAAENGVKSVSMCPQWMPVCLPPRCLKLVCGRPMSGKTDYVKKHCAPGDLIIDLEQMAKDVKRDLNSLSQAQLYALIRYRNEVISNYMRGLLKKHSCCWIVTTAGSKYARDYWKDHGAEVIIIDLPVEESVKMIAAADIPEPAKLKMIDAAQDWK
jgi:5-methylcytosine-specific restriction enzyme A